MTATITAPASAPPTPLDGAAGGPRRRIVIGADGSPASVDALRWARRQLIEPTDVVCVVTAYQYPAFCAEAPLPEVGLRECADRARAAAEDAIRDVFGPDEPGGSIEHVVELSSIDRLIERSGTDAALVVLGSRSRRRFRDRLRRSATNRITGRVSCPVISVPQCSTAR